MPRERALQIVLIQKNTHKSVAWIHVENFMGKKNAALLFLDDKKKIKKNKKQLFNILIAVSFGILRTPSYE